MKKILLLTLSMLVGISALFAQQRVTGTVIFAEDGSPLPYVTVVVAGTTITSQTDLDGVYSINVPAGREELTFTYVGMQTVTVQIAGRSVVDVEMVSDAVALEDVIVVAYGTAKKE
ncbi:MAG: carboxypeptidase-like regulatory domain-containing protein, partial [Bacteroidales bacterium]|nr:carboxypeptidase-like regulatory domain-containing protein [Bacteroidales bacterium]